MNARRNVYASICVNSLVLGTFFLMLRELNVFMQLLFSFVPIVLSIVVSVMINGKKISEKDDCLKCAVIYSGFNLISLVVEYICISLVIDANDIYKIGQKYNSEYITVSENNSPIFSVIIFSIASFVFHYFAMKKSIDRGKENITKEGFLDE